MLLRCPIYYTVSFFVLVSRVRSQGDQGLFRIKNSSNYKAMFLPVYPFKICGSLLPLPNENKCGLLTCYVVTCSLTVVQGRSGIRFKRYALRNVRRFLLDLFIRTFVFYFGIRPCCLLTITCCTNFNSN